MTLGKFDGLHRGHQKLIERVRDHASDETVSIVCSFDMGKDMLLTETEKRKRLEPETDVLIFTSFHERIRQMEPETFIKEVLVERFHAAYVVVGTDFCFGHEKSWKCGDAKTIMQMFTAIVWKWLTRKCMTKM